MNRAKDHSDFALVVLEAMASLISADYISLHVLNTESDRLLNIVAPENPYTESETAYYQAHSEENPLVAYYQRTQDAQSRRMSDVVTQEEYLSSGVYRHCNSRIGIPFMLALPFQVDDQTVAGLTFMRKQQDFTPGDCELLNMFAPHFCLAWRKHPDPWTTGKSEVMSA